MDCRFSRQKRPPTTSATPLFPPVVPFVPLCQLRKTSSRGAFTPPRAVVWFFFLPFLLSFSSSSSPSSSNSLSESFKSICFFNTHRARVWLLPLPRTKEVPKSLPFWNLSTYGYHFIAFLSRPRANKAGYSSCTCWLGPSYCCNCVRLHSLVSTESEIFPAFSSPLATHALCCDSC